MTTERTLQNNLLLWIDAKIRDDDTNTQHTLEQLRGIVYRVNLFTQIDDCLPMLHEVKNEKLLIITSESLGSELLKRIHHLPQVDAVYILCDHSDQPHPCITIQTAVKQTNQDLTPISFLTLNAVGTDESTLDLNRLEPSFMYTTLFKRILLEMKHESDDRQAIVKFCRTHYTENPVQLNIVEEFNRDYRPEKAIWWYTRECFMYQLLNRALRLLESDIIVDMGFFIHDLHRQIEQLRQEQISDYLGNPLTLYRGQRLSKDDFTKLTKIQGGLLAFNSFLSTSTTKSVSLRFARRFSSFDNMVGVLFVMVVDPAILSATFASIEKHSFFKTENEVLFSMHTVFRINDIVELVKEEHLFEVHLMLTDDNDPELRQLTNRIDENLGSENGWAKLERLLLDIGQTKKSEELYLVLLQQKPTERDQGHYYNLLGSIKTKQSDFKQAKKYFERAISIGEKIFSPINRDLAAVYNNIGSLYENMAEYSQALYYVKKSLDIREKILSPIDPSLADSYNNIGLLYNSMGEYSQALPYHKKSLAISERTLPADHLDLASSYNNIGSLYNNMGEYSQALSYFKKSLAISEKTLPADHPDLTTSYNNIGAVYDAMEEYSQAISYYKKALGMREKTLPVDHPSLAPFYNNIGSTYHKLKEYSQAKTYFEKTLKILRSSLPAGHPNIKIAVEWLADVNVKLKK